MQANGPRNTEEESVVRRAQHGGEEQARTGAVVCPGVCQAWCRCLQGTATTRHSLQGTVELRRRGGHSERHARETTC